MTVVNFVYFAGFFAITAAGLYQLCLHVSDKQNALNLIEQWGDLGELLLILTGVSELDERELSKDTKNTTREMWLCNSISWTVIMVVLTVVAMVS
jgi:hypothetical protein